MTAGERSTPLLESGRVAVVTGAASGIGRALAEAFAARGLQVVMADIENDALSAAVDEVMTSTGAAVIGVQVDVSNADQVDNLALRTVAEFGVPDIVCANAGVITPRMPIWEQPAADWSWTVAVNLLGPANAVRAFVPQMVARGSGHLVFTASIAGLAPLPGGGNGAYSASKYAVVGLAETLRIELDELAPDIGVTVLCPARCRPACRRRAGTGLPRRRSNPAGPDQQDRRPVSSWGCRR